MRHVAAFVGVVALVAACAGTSTPAPPASGGAPTTGPGASAPASSALGPVGKIALKTGSDLCGLLGPDDFTAAGVAGAGAVSKNSLDPTSFYCVYAGKSSGTGGIEFDAFITDPTTVDDSFGGISPPVASPVDVTAAIPGADKALADPTGEAGYASVGVRSGNLVFDVGFPPSANAKDQLTGLAALVIRRAAALSSGSSSLPAERTLPDDACTWVTTGDVGSISSIALTGQPPKIEGELGFNDTTVSSTILGKQVTCLWWDEGNRLGLEVDFLTVPHTPDVMRKVYDEEAAWYAQVQSAGGGELAYVVSPLAGIGTAGQKVHIAYSDGSGWIGWTDYAIQGTGFVRIRTDKAGGATEGADAAVTTLLKKLLDKEAATLGE